MIALSAVETMRIPTELGELAVHVVGDGRRGDQLGGGRPAGTASRPDTVGWHSMFVDSRSWSRLIALLPDRRFYLIDAPSCGASERLSGAVDISACTRAAAEVVGALGLSEVDWIGNAWGGHVGIELAATRPDLVRSLIAISAPTFPIPMSLRAQVRLLLPIYRVFGARGPVGSTIMQTLLTDETRRSDAEVVELLDACLAESGVDAVDAITTCILNRTDLLWAARRVTCPTLFVTTDDRGEWTSEQARGVVDQMVNASLTEIVGARVIPALEQPAPLAEAMTTFWERLVVSG